MLSDSLDPDQDLQSESKLFTWYDVCCNIRGGGGDYVLVVKFSGGDYVLVVKFTRGGYVLVVKFMGGILSTYTKMSRGVLSGGDYVRILSDLDLHRFLFNQSSNHILNICRMIYISHDL